MKKLTIALLVAGVVISLIAATAVFAQDREGGDRRPAGERGDRGDRGDRGGRGDRAGRMGAFNMGRMRMFMPAEIATTDKYLFVVKGNDVYQFDVDSLKLLKKVQLEEEEDQNQGQEKPQAEAPF